VAEFRIGSTFGFEISIDTSWFILLALILWSFTANVFPGMLPGLSSPAYFLMGATGTVLFFVSLLLHELSHALVARARGIPVEGITLFIFGGVARTAREAERPGEEFQIAGVGPLTSFLLAGVFWAIAGVGERYGLDPALVTVAGLMAMLNLALAVFNLLPGFPLDGGRLLRSALWKATGDLTRATKWASLAGRGLGWALIALALVQIFYGYALDGLWLALIGWFLRNAAIRSYRVHLIVKQHDRARATLERLAVARTDAGGDFGSGAARRTGPPADFVPGDDRFVIPAERLPPGFAETIEERPDRPAEPRPAATIVLMRDGEAGPQALLLKRHRSSGFVPGAYVFPGGRIDAADADPAVLARAPGLPAQAQPDAAYWVGAAREVFEETGVLLGEARRPDALPSLRERLMNDEATMLDVLEAADARLDMGDLVHIAHWITPEVEPRRYDTHFFLAGLPDGAQVAIDVREMTDALWLEPARALAHFEAGRLPMVFPTVRTLADLAGYASVAEAMATLRGRTVRPILPRLVRRGGGVGIELPDDDDAAAGR